MSLSEEHLVQLGSSNAIEKALKELREAYDAKLSEHAQALQDSAQATIREKEKQIQALEETVQKLMEENGRLTVERNQLLLEAREDQDGREAVLGKSSAETSRLDQIEHGYGNESGRKGDHYQEHRQVVSTNTLSVDDLEVSSRYAFSSQNQAAPSKATTAKLRALPLPSPLPSSRDKRMSPPQVGSRTSMASDILSEIDASLAKHERGRGRDRDSPIALRSRAKRLLIRQSRKERKVAAAETTTTGDVVSTGMKRAATSDGGGSAPTPYIRVHRTGSIDLHGLPAMAAAAAASTASNSAAPEEKAESASRLHASGLEFFREARRRLAPESFESVLSTVSAMNQGVLSRAEGVEDIVRRLGSPNADLAERLKRLMQR